MHLLIRRFGPIPSSSRATAQRSDFFGTHRRVPRARLLWWCLMPRS